MLCVFKIQFILILLQIAAGCNNIKYLNTDREHEDGQGICVCVEANGEYWKYLYTLKER
jgi:hypothetical protein